MNDNDIVIHKLLDDFTRAREELSQHLRRKGFSGEQAHAKIMKFQCETQRAYRTFKDMGFKDAEHCPPYFMKDREGWRQTYEYVPSGNNLEEKC
tara:strand:+ start:213 stop:494 length:282 start_codon:yes stop_codon:yes gene_type:complete